MLIFQNLDANTFLFNNIRLPKIYIIIKTSNTHLGVYNAYDTKQQLIPSTHFNEFEINGVVYTSLAALTNVLTPLIFAKSSSSSIVTGTTGQIGNLQQVTNNGNVTTNNIICDAGAGIQFSNSGNIFGSLINNGSKLILNEGLNGKTWSLDRSYLTTNRNYILPNLDGTFALTSQLTPIQNQISTISATSLANTNLITSLANTVSNLPNLISETIIDGVTTSAPSQNAVFDALTGKADKNYVDNLVVGLLNDRGSFNASNNLYPISGGSGVSGTILKGDLWYVSTAGNLGGVNVNVGDSFRALINNPSQNSANWAILEGNLGYVPANANNTVNLTGNQTIFGIKLFENNSSHLTIRNGIVINNDSTVTNSAPLLINTNNSNNNVAINVKKQNNDVFKLTNNGELVTNKIYVNDNINLYDYANGTFLKMYASEDSLNFINEDLPMFYYNFNDCNFRFYKKGNAATANFDYASITTNRTYSLPNKSGTIALTNDINIPVTGIFTPATNGNVTFSKSYFTKIGNLLTMQINGSINITASNFTTTLTFNLPNNFTIANPFNNRIAGFNAIGNGSNAAAGTIKVTENTTNNTLILIYGGANLTLTTYNFSITVVLEVN